MPVYKFMPKEFGGMDDFMDNQVFYVAARIDAATFRRFAIFDSLRLRRVWRSPLVFALILTISACVCFMLQDRAEQAGLLGGVLLTVGLGLPCCYFLNFFLSIRTQIKRMRLDQQPKIAYTLNLSKEQGVSVSAGEEQITLTWEDLFGAYRAPGCIYLYATPNRAYLLPESQIDGNANDLWKLIGECIPHKTPNRVRDIR